MFELCNRETVITYGKYGMQYVPFVYEWPSLHALQTFYLMSLVWSFSDEFSTWNKITLWKLFVFSVLSTVSSHKLLLSVEHIFYIDDYLGQVIVPLSTVNRDQTCRLILPVLPKSSKSEHSKGDITLEVRRRGNATLSQCDSSWKFYDDLVYNT